MVWNDKKLVKILKGNGIVVMPTDTLYGIVARAEDKNAVERIYKIRKRDPEKPCIILIGKIGELEKFSIILSERQRSVIKKYWSIDSLRQDSEQVVQDKPEPVSIVLDCPGDSLTYLHRGTKTLAFRLPFSKLLRDLLLKTGPLIAPSANIEGLPSAQNITEAKKYFGNSIDLYVDGGKIKGRASKIIKSHSGGSVDVLRL